MADAPHSAPTSRPPAATEEDAIERRTLRDYLIILREHLWIALPLALIAAIGFAYVKSTAAPLYRSTASMRIEKPETLVTSQQIVDASSRSDVDLNTYLVVLKSQTLRDRVIATFTPDEIELLQTPYLADLPPGREPPPVAATIGEITVQSVRTNFLVKLGVTHRDPAAAALIANRYVEQFMAHLIDTLSAESAPAIQHLETRARELRAEAYAAENALLAHTTQKPLLSREGQASPPLDDAEQERERLRLSAIDDEFTALQTAALTAQKQYTEVLNRLNQAVTSRNLEKVPVSPLDPALPALAPFSPDPTSITRTAIIIGLAVFFGVTFVLSSIDDRIKSTWDVENSVGTTLLGIVPDLSALPDREKHRLILDNKNERVAESFLGVYSAVKTHSKLDFPKAVLVTSTIPGEGKTLVSCNLAGSFARHGKRTILVDCNLRSPALHQHFAQENTRGLLRWFDSGAEFHTPTLAENADLGIVSVGEKISLLRAGGHSKTPTELLESPAFAQLIDRLKHEYDLVVVDSPPLGTVTDSLLIAETTDEVVYVCRFNRALRKHIRLYIKALRQGKNEVLGIVLNGLGPRRIEYYSNYRNYRSYKKYYGTTT